MDIPETGPMRLLYDEHAAALWRYALRLTGDLIRAQHVMQEVLTRAQRQLEIRDGAAPPARAWLFAEVRTMIGADRPGLGRTPSNGSGALDPLLHRMLVGDAIGQLPEAYYAVVQRSYYQGRTTGQIAADLGIPDDEVKSRLHHALRALRQSLLEMGLEMGVVA